MQKQQLENLLITKTFEPCTNTCISVHAVVLSFPYLTNNFIISILPFGIESSPC